MKNLTLITTVLILFLAATLGNSNLGNVLAQENESAQANAALAIGNPDKFAWMLFAELNQKAPMGDGNTVVWETWGLARKVYNNPAKPPTWLEAGESDKSDRKDRFDSLPIQQRILQKSKRSERPNSFHDSSKGAQSFLDVAIISGDETMKSG